MFVFALDALLFGATPQVGQMAADEEQVWLLVWPGLACVVGFGLAVCVFYCCVDKVDKWLARDRTRRITFQLFLALLVPTVAALLLDVVDLSRILDGRISRVESVLLSIVAVTGVAYLWGQLVLLTHADRWDQRVLTYQNAAREAQARASSEREYRDFLLALDSVCVEIRRPQRGSREKGARPDARRRRCGAASGSGKTRRSDGLHHLRRLQAV